MNPNFDFRDSSAWDDREIKGSVGDALPGEKALGIAASIVTFVAVILVTL
jgi:hypothetical protein